MILICLYWFISTCKLYCIHILSWDRSYSEPICFGFCIFSLRAFFQFSSCETNLQFMLWTNTDLFSDTGFIAKYYQIMTDNKLFEAVDIPCQHKDLIHDVAYDYFGHRLATASSDQTVKIWDYDQETKKWICTASWKCHFGSVWKVTWVSLSRCFSRKKRFNYTHSDT